MNPADALQIMVDHVANGGTLDGTSPLLAMARDALKPARHGLTDEQLAMRKTGIGASEAPMLANVSPHGGPIDLFMRKMGLSSDSPTDAQELGNLLEEGIVRWYEKKVGATCAPATTLRHAAHPWMLATPDRWVNGTQKLLQVKLVGTWMAHHWSDDAIPDYVNVQVQQEMEVANVEILDVVALLGGTDPRIYQVERDRELGEAIVEIDRAFWHDHVLPRVPPPVDGSKSATELLKRLYPFRRSVLLEADERAEAAARAYMDSDRAIVSCEHERDLAEQRLKMAIGDAEGLRGMGWSCTWRANVNKVRSFKFKDEMQSKKGRAA